MSHCLDVNEKLFIVDAVNDAVIAYAHSPAITRVPQFLTAIRPWIGRERIDGCLRPQYDIHWQVSQLLLC